MKEIKAWSTEDGLVFKDKQKAAKHQELLNFEKFYDKDPMNSGEGYRVSSQTILSWLRRNKENIQKFLETI